MKLKTENKITAGFAFALAIMLLVSIVSYIRITGFLKVSKLARHPHAVIENIDDAFSNIQAAA